MKTSHNKKNIIIRFISAALFATALLISKPTSGKNIIPGIRLSDYITGNQLGANLSASLFLKYNHFDYSFGANFQQRRPHFAGVQGSLSYDFGNPDGKVSVFAFGTFIYHQGSGLGKGCIKTQQQVSSETPVHYENIKLNTMEMYAGFGINIRHSDFISSSWGVGVGMYNTLCPNYQSMNLLRDKSAAALLLKCSLSFNFKRSK